MPLEESYRESLKSGVADPVNTAGRQGDAIKAASFLKQFVDEKVQWMPVDVAGPAWRQEKGSDGSWHLDSCRVGVEELFLDALGYNAKSSIITNKHIKGGISILEVSKVVHSVYFSAKSFR
ncbi:hypothetical protein BT93_C0117 [Corymbia citriodora subsp. variegata]|nr:hypothetical protein BT93_C0117 [Corymbia citriodora subsp. variegata]